MVSGLWYEENILGHTTDKTYVTQYTIDYLYDNFYSTVDIVKILSTFRKEFIKYCDLPSSLWNGLIKRDTYYFHPELQILSQPPKLNIGLDIEVKEVKFFKEMKISYTKEQLLSYYYKKANPLTIRDAKRDVGAIDYLLNRYGHQLMDSLDILLYLIDDHAHEVSSLLNLTNYEVDTLEKVESIYWDNHRAGLDKVFYRWS